MCAGATILSKVSMNAPAKSTTPAQERQQNLDKHKASDKYVGVFPFEFEEAKAVAAIPTTIQLIPIGEWEHDLYGKILITTGDIQEFVDNFNAGIRKGVPITAGHEGYEELPAEGWILKVKAKEDGLWGEVEWTENGKALLADKAFKFFSPEFYREYEDPQTHKLYRNVLVGGALTKSPYFKELQAIVFSEPKIKKLFTDTMELATLLAKPIAELTDDEKAFIKANKDSLTDEQKASHTAVIEEPAPEETDEERNAREEKEKGDANEAAGLNRDGSAKTDAPAADAPVAGSEKVVITASELAILRKKADEGAQAFAEAKKLKMDNTVAQLTFSDKNKDGKFLPKSTDTLRKFAESLSDSQLTAFTALMKEQPATMLFKEVGAGTGAIEGTPQAAIEAKVAVKMSEDKKLRYSDALKIVMSENPDLETSYDSELKTVRG